MAEVKNSVRKCSGLGRGQDYFYSQPTEVMCGAKTLQTNSVIGWADLIGDKIVARLVLLSVNVKFY